MAAPAPGATPLPEGLPAAVLWDMDGVLVDSEPLWTQAERALCASWGVEFRAETKAAMMGRRLDASMPILLAACGLERDPTEAGRQLLALMVELLSAGAPLRPGALALLQALSGAGVPQALVSSSYRVLVEALPRAVLDHFAVTLAGDEVPHAKPDPGPYREAAARLGVAMAQCVVLEDSAPGARAGAAAGARVVLIPSVVAVAAEPGWVLSESLEQLTPSLLGELLARRTGAGP